MKKNFWEKEEVGEGDTIGGKTRLVHNLEVGKEFLCSIY
jgi:hypothetical protein